MQLRRPVPPEQLRLAVATFAILVLELALIRWLSTQVRIAAYFANLVLLAAFLGMGLGIGMRNHAAFLSRWGLPALALASVLIASAAPLGFVHVRFPSLAPTEWGSSPGGAWWQFAGAAALVTTCFWAVAALFLFPGAIVGVLFEALPPLEAYAWDLGGSLAGVVAMAFMAAFWLPPPAWIAVAAGALLYLSRSWWGAIAVFVSVVAAAYSIDGAIFSPYNRIDLVRGTGEEYGIPASRSAEWTLGANRDYYQRLIDLRPGTPETPARHYVREVYELPFMFSEKPGRSAAIVGAGTGNDVSAALRRGFARVVSIDIDPAILQVGAQLHPEKPYSDPRALRVNDDARAFFGRPSDERFDVVCYGLLDSHALFSSMSSLRLDNFVYTREGLADAWAHVADDGVLSVSHSVFAGDWIFKRMVGMVREATGIDPIVVRHHYDDGATFLVGRHLTLERVRAVADAQQLSMFPGERIPSDDWPFLYLRSGELPWTYLTVFAMVALTAAFAVRGVFGASLFSASRFDSQLFLLGAAFMLLETRAVTQLSLLFGSTWIVNTTVFGGVLVMVMAANFAASRLGGYRRGLWYSFLALSLVALWLLPTHAFFVLPLWARALLAGPAVAVPIFFAGVIFSSELRQRTDYASALGCNLCGALLGGLLENLSMLLGLKAIVLIALGLYALSLVARRRASAGGGVGPPGFEPGTKGL